MHPETRIIRHLTLLYGKRIAYHTWAQLQPHLQEFQTQHTALQNPSPIADLLTQKDAILITYGDQIREENQTPLQTLANFYHTHLQELISIIHILPFFPYSSDDGFSIIDYREVDPKLGTWDDIDKLRQYGSLMFDAVINHISRQSKWFQGYCRGENPYTDYFITVDPNADLSQVVRPRALPLLTTVETRRGTRRVWTTFSKDQIDLNYTNPKVLLEIIAVLLFYVEHGTKIIRLDAVAYLWKEIGTPCIHLPQTHRVIKLFRAILDLVAPDVILITETNVPHMENISYFGEPLTDVSGDEASQRGDEAQMVYQFPLAPLVLHTFHTGNARALTNWTASLQAPFPSAIFFNFIASHDGIGVRPAEGLLTPDEIQALVERTLNHGGQVSYKTNADGTQSVYELNITLYDVLNNPYSPHPDIDIQRFLASQAIMLSLSGVPGIYIHSLFGSRNCHECVKQTGRSRSINRKKFRREDLESALSNPESRTAQVYYSYTKLLKIRREHPAFHPQGPQRVLQLHDKVFALLRTAPNDSEAILCLINVTDQPQTLELSAKDLELPSRHWHDTLSDKVSIDLAESPQIAFDPYQVLWLQNDKGAFHLS